MTLSFSLIRVVNNGLDKNTPYECLKTYNNTLSTTTTTYELYPDEKTILLSDLPVKPREDIKKLRETQKTVVLNESIRAICSYYPKMDAILLDGTLFVLMDSEKTRHENQILLTRIMKCKCSDEPESTFVPYQSITVDHDLNGNIWLKINVYTSLHDRDAYHSLTRSSLSFINYSRSNKILKLRKSLRRLAWQRKVKFMLSLCMGLVPRLVKNPEKPSLGVLSVNLIDLLIQMSL